MSAAWGDIMTDAWVYMGQMLTYIGGVLVIFVAIYAFFMLVSWFWGLWFG